jgi:hypothetical protein
VGTLAEGDGEEALPPASSVRSAMPGSRLLDGGAGAVGADADCGGAFPCTAEGPALWMGSTGVARGVTLDEIRCSSARRVRKPRLAFQQT